MALTFKNILANVGITNGTVYTSPTATEAIIFTLSVTNLTGNTPGLTLTINDGSDNIILNNVAQIANNVLFWDKNLVLEAGHFLKANSSAAGSFVINLGLVERT